jgi:hypothetical protein
VVAACPVPDGMTTQVHQFDGCRERIVLSLAGLLAPGIAGKSAPQIDTCHGHFQARAGPAGRRGFEFEAADAALRGEMTITSTLTDADDAANVVIVHEGMPDALPPADNDTGMRMALTNLARLVEET